MHCPQCGQQQVSDEMRFCSRCGFALSIVTELLVTGGTLPERQAESFAGKFTGRKRGKRLGLLLMITGFVPLKTINRKERQERKDHAKS